ncbi:MAG: CAP domain-containing protein [Acidobacteriota bacterium]|nr:CAP domain-containing protein [Acidobacteriota bacterium]
MPHGWPRQLPLIAALTLAAGQVAALGALPQSAVAHGPSVRSAGARAGRSHRHGAHRAILCSKRHRGHHRHRHATHGTHGRHHGGARGRCATTPSRHRAAAGRRPSAKLSVERRRVDLAQLANATCANTTVRPQVANLSAIRASVLCLIDRERARNGEHPLLANHRLEQAAQRHTEDMVENDYFEHVGPSGQSLGDRLRASGFIYSSNLGYVVGENIAWGTLEDSTAQAIVAAWMASPEHRANILDARFRDTGVGVVARVPGSLGEGQPGAMYTQDFGLLIRP